MSLKLCAHAHTPTYWKKEQKVLEKALEELKSREDLVRTNADKEDAVVILDVNDNIKDSERQLNDNKNYRHSENDSTTENNATFNNRKQRNSQQSYNKIQKRQMNQL